jgi:hypothetical protein
MKLFVLFHEVDFVLFLELLNLPNCPETFQRFLKDIGTTQISFQPSTSSFLEVSPGSCIRLRAEKDYVLAIAKLVPHEKQDKSRRTSSCTIV